MRTPTVWLLWCFHRGKWTLQYVQSSKTKAEEVLRNERRINQLRREDWRLTSMEAVPPKDTP